MAVEQVSVGAIIVAAGQSRRMGGADKMFAKVNCKPVLWYSLQALQACPSVDAICLVLHSSNLERGRALVAESRCSKVVAVCPGGERRQDSVRRGLEALPRCEWVLVHDGARPCLDQGILERGLVAVKTTGAAVAAVPVKDTIKEAAADGVVMRTLPRESLWAVQTPQVFRYDALVRAHREVSLDVTDDAAMVEALGGKVVVFQGAYTNIKVTTPEDLAVVEMFLKGRT